MEYLLDTANIEEIKECSQFIPITGITTNPSIIKNEGKIDFFAHFKEIRKMIGMDKTLHIQVVGKTYEEILKDARAILKNVDEKVYIKIPVTEEGLKAMSTLKKEGVNITATAIYTKMQGFLAIVAGADYIVPYFNRMENMDIDAKDAIQSFSQIIQEYDYKAKVLAASFKNMKQVNDAFIYGAQKVTIVPSLLKDGFKMPSIKKAVDDFITDWESIFGKGATIATLDHLEHR